MIWKSFSVEHILLVCIAASEARKNIFFFCISIDSKRVYIYSYNVLFLPVSIRLMLYTNQMCWRSRKKSWNQECINVNKIPQNDWAVEKSFRKKKLFFVICHLRNAILMKISNEEKQKKTLNLDNQLREKLKN